MDKRFTSHRPQAAKAPPAKPETEAGAEQPQAPSEPAAKAAGSTKPKEIGGPSGPEPTRYGDWERKGICYDF